MWVVSVFYSGVARDYVYGGILSGDNRSCRPALFNLHHRHAHLIRFDGVKINKIKTIFTRQVRQLCSEWRGFRITVWCKIFNVFKLGIVIVGPPIPLASAKVKGLFIFRGFPCSRAVAVSVLGQYVWVFGYAPFSSKWLVWNFLGSPTSSLAWEWLARCLYISFMFEICGPPTIFGPLGEQDGLK